MEFCCATLGTSIELECDRCNFGGIYGHWRCGQPDLSRGADPDVGTESRAVSIDRLVELWSTFVGAPADNPTLAAIMAKGLTDYEKLDIEERIQVSAHISRFMRVFEAIYMHHLDRTIDEEIWDGLSTSVSETMSAPMTKQWWPTRRLWFGKRFRDHIDSIVQSEAQSDLYALKSP